MATSDSEILAAVAGAAALSLDSAARILEATHVCGDDLLHDEARIVFVLFCERIRSRLPLERAAVRESLKAKTEGVRVLAQTALTHPNLTTAEEVLAAAHETGLRRRLNDAMRKVAAANENHRALGEVEAMLRALPDTLQSAGSRVRSARGDSAALLEHLEAQWAGRGQRALPLGLGAIDETLGGLINNLTVVGARPGVGKSSLVAGLVRNWVTAGHRVGVLAYEDDARDMACRIAACHAGVELREMRGDKANVSEEIKTRCHEGLAWYAQHEHLIEVDDHRPAGTPDDALRSIRVMASRGCRAVLLDNLTCVRLDGPEDRRHDLLVERALGQIRSEAQGLRIPIVVVGHLRRHRETDGEESERPPRLSDFSNAVAWENYARLALGLWRAGGTTCLRVLKNTNGPAGGDFDLVVNRSAAVVTGSTHRVENQPESKPQAKNAPRFGGRPVFVVPD